MKSRQHQPLNEEESRQFAMAIQSQAFKSSKQSLQQGNPPLQLKKAQSSYQSQRVTDEDYQQAQQSLRLLKSKMRSRRDSINKEEEQQDDYQEKQQYENAMDWQQWGQEDEVTTQSSSKFGQKQQQIQVVKQNKLPPSIKQAQVPAKKGLSTIENDDDRPISKASAKIYQDIDSIEDPFNTQQQQSFDTFKGNQINSSKQAPKNQAKQSLNKPPVSQKKDWDFDVSSKPYDPYEYGNDEQEQISNNKQKKPIKVEISQKQSQIQNQNPNQNQIQNQNQSQNQNYRKVFKPVDEQQFSYGGFEQEKEKVSSYSQSRQTKVGVAQKEQQFQQQQQQKVNQPQQVKKGPVVKNQPSVQQNNNNKFNQQKDSGYLSQQNKENELQSITDIDNRVAKATGQKVLPDEYSDQREKLYECSEGCGRRFNQKALEKHEPNCRKVFQEKRKAFDSKQFRLPEEMEQLERNNNQNLNKKKKPTANKNSNQQQKIQDDRQIEANNKKAKWKQQSEAFRAVIKQSTGAKLSVAEQKAYDNAAEMQDTLVPCPICGRKFNETAAQRHLPFCKEKSKMDALKKGGNSNSTKGQIKPSSSSYGKKF